MLVQARPIRALRLLLGRLQVRHEDDAQYLLVIIGATPEGKKELVGLVDGVRESAQSWRELLLDLKRRGLAMGPKARSPPCDLEPYVPTALAMIFNLHRRPKRVGADLMDTANCRK